MQPYLKNLLARPWSERRAAFPKPWRILVVDDNQEGGEAIAAYLYLELMECKVAFGGLQAITVGTTWLPHVIVMDISMPGLNGFDATHALRQDLRTGHIVILAFTALDEIEVLRHQTHSMFDGYCQKAQSPTVLATLIRHFMA